MTFLLWLQPHLRSFFDWLNWVMLQERFLYWMGALLLVMCFVVSVTAIVALVQYGRETKALRADPEYAEYKRLFEKFGPYRK